MTVLSRFAIVAAVLSVTSAKVVHVDGIDYVHTPAGLLAASCVTEVPSGSRVIRFPDKDQVVFPNGSVFDYPRCDEEPLDLHVPDIPRTSSIVPAPVPYSGWTTYTTYNNAAVAAFNATFNVPDNPTGSPNPLYLFNALQNIDWVPVVDGNSPTGPFDIIQPVLGYYGNYWGIDSWIVSINGGRTFHSNLIKVTAGTNLFGVMVEKNPSTAEWFINTVDLKSNQQTSITVSNSDDTDGRLKTQPWSYTAVECYYCSGCSTYPDNTLTFSGMKMADSKGNVITPSWTAHEGKYHWCNEHATIVSPAQVQFTFQQ
jgi:hypothetical protein